MSSYCEFYIRHEMNQINDDEYEMHVQSCPQCKDILKQDDALLKLAQSLKQPIDSADVWEQIELVLKKKKSKNIFHLPSTSRRLILRIAAVLILGTAIGFYFFQQNDIPDKGIVTVAMLERLDKKEQEYLKSIEELEKATQGKMAGMDINLMLLYVSRLEVIDAQIAECKEAIADNPANAHIHKYLFAALKEKKATLKEIYKLKADNPKEDS